MGRVGGIRATGAAVLRGFRMRVPGGGVRSDGGHALAVQEEIWEDDVLGGQG